MREETTLRHTDSAQIEPAEEAPALEPLPLTYGAPAPPETPRRPVWHRVLIGQSGLRPGWGLLLFVIFLIVFSAGIGTVVRKFHHPAHNAGQQTKSGGVVPQSSNSVLMMEGASFSLVALVTWIMSRVERRPVGAYGFGGTRKVGPFFAGLVWGAVFLSVLVGALWKAGLLVFDGRLLYGSSALRYGAVWAIAFVLVGLFEEYLLRGYLQVTLSRGLTSLYNMLFDTVHGEALGFWTAAIILSFLFGLGHGSNPGESPIGLVSAGLVGLVFCLSLWRTGSLWWVLGFHASWDWAQSFLFGVADSGTMVEGHLLATHPVGKVVLSGGATGPEGSVFVLPVLAAAALVVLWTLPARRASLNRTEQQPLAAD